MTRPKGLRAFVSRFRFSPTCLTYRKPVNSQRIRPSRWARVHSLVNPRTSQFRTLIPAHLRLGRPPRWARLQPKTAPTHSHELRLNHFRWIGYGATTLASHPRHRLPFNCHLHNCVPRSQSLSRLMGTDPRMKSKGSMGKHGHTSSDASRSPRFTSAFPLSAGSRRHSVFRVGEVPTERIPRTPFVI